MEVHTDDLFGLGSDQHPEFELSLVENAETAVLGATSDFEAVWTDLKC